MKQPKIDSFRSSRTPNPEAVSMPEDARPIKKVEKAKPSLTTTTERMNGDTERVNRTVIKNTDEKSVLDEMNQGVVETKRRPTERYSFEIFTDQKQKIRDLQYQYEKRMGKRLSSSRIIREAIEVYLEKVLNLEGD
ncbi:MAG: hypothetical protein JW953_17620 [Anaerolineae bacterium]|nr:hypothetical protein [Anaerolineae bacterium]